MKKMVKKNYSIECIAECLGFHLDSEVINTLNSIIKSI